MVECDVGVGVGHRSILDVVKRSPRRCEGHAVLDGQEPLLVIDQVRSAFGRELRSLRHNDRILRARLDAHPAENAAKHVDLEPVWIFLSIRPGRLGSFDRDAIGWTGGCAHIARNALRPALIILG